MSSFQWIGIEEFCISECWNREGSTVYRGVFISGSCNREVPLFTEVSSFDKVEIEGFHCTSYITMTFPLYIPDRDNINSSPFIVIIMSCFSSLFRVSILSE